MSNFNQLFTKLENWRFQHFNPQVGITDPNGTAYIVEFVAEYSSNKVRLDQFQALLQDPHASQIQALICQINYSKLKPNTPFGVVLEALCDAREELPHLKALFIGDRENHKYRKSKLNVFDIRPLLEAYPKLQVLQVRGCFSEYELECQSLRHEHLKTLIIETADFENQNLAQICALELPALEYLELWLGRHLYYSTDCLLPIFFGESFPNLSYLGLRSSDHTNQIAATVVQSSIIDRLTVLDLSMGNLTDEGAETLLNCPAINQLLTLDVSMNCLSLSLIQKLAQLDCQVKTEPQDSYEGDRYSALHE